MIPDNYNSFVTKKLNKSNKFVKALVVLLCLNLFLCSLVACGVDRTATVVEVQEEQIIEEPEVKQSQDTLYGNIAGEIQENGDLLVDLEKIPQDLRRMFSLCEAVALGIADSGIEYSYESPYLVWHSLHIAMVKSGWREDKVQETGGRTITNFEMVRDYMFGMFGELAEAPSIPAVLSQPDEDGKIQITFNNNLDYSFGALKMFDEYAVVSKVVCHPDTSAEVDVCIKDYFGNEIAFFRFLLRSNTKDTGMAATFHYEIIDAIPLDELTVTRMSGYPFAVQKIAKYGSNVKKTVADKNKDIMKNPHANIVEEKLAFSVFGNENDDIRRLNKRLDDELYYYKEKVDSLWYEIRSYASENDKYAQIVMTCVLYGEDSVKRKVLTYNYDAIARKEITKEDASELKGMSESELVETLAEELDKKGIDDYRYNIEYTGFVINLDDSVDYYFAVSYLIDDKMDEHIVRYNPVNNILEEIVEEEELNLGEYFEVDTVNLSHGR